MAINEKELVARFYSMIAPRIIGNTLAKKLATLQIFTNPAVGEKLHLMLVGEPASGKTMIGFDVSQIAPSSTYSASNLTRVGLLEKLIISNGGIMVIDEFGRLKKDVRDGLLEAMQTGTVSIDKHSRHERFDAKVNIMSIANPRGDRMVNGMSVLQQLPYGHALLSRFHFIIPFWSVDEDLYPDIAKGFVYDNNDRERIRMLRDIVVKIKTKIPVVSIDEKIASEIGDFVRFMKSASFFKEIVTPRMIEGMISMAKAHARLNLRDKVTESDVREIEVLVRELDETVKGNS